MRVLLLMTCGYALSMLGTNSLFAQHLDWHGDHFDIHQNVPHGHDRAGHLVDGFGHHIDGHGRHTGGTGVFEDGSRDHNSHDYYRNNYNNLYSGYRSYYPGYRSYASPRYSLPYDVSSYYRLPNYVSRYSVSPYYSTGPNVYLAPSIATANPRSNASAITILPQSTVGGTSIAANKIPATDANSIARSSLTRSGAILLRNPRESGGAVNYQLNGYSYTINPGELQTLPLDREWIITIENGLGKTVSYRLQSGEFDFRVSSELGWEIAQRIQPDEQ